MAADLSDAWTDGLAAMLSPGLAGLPPEVGELIERNRELPQEVIGGILAAGQVDGAVQEYDAGDRSVLFRSIIKGLALHRATRGRVFGRSRAELLEAVFLEDES